MKNINLCELLKGHEGKTFYSPIYGEVKFLEIIDNYTLRVSSKMNTSHFFLKDGRYSTYSDAECLLFPSKSQRDWNKWAKEQKSKVPKTWKQCLDAKAVSIDYLDSVGHLDDINEFNSDVINAAIALIKINRIIEIGYGGNITNEEWENDSIKYVIRHFNKQLAVDAFKCSIRCHIAFHTKEQAEEFLSHLENIQLLKDFFMIQ